MSADRWLDRWQGHLGEPADVSPVLELGCNEGADTSWLREHGYSVVACDLDGAALAECARRVPGARLVRLDLRVPLPFGIATFGAVVAGLSLHYFDWDVTERIMADLHRALRPDGLLLVRVNSTKDVHFGAVGHPAIDPGFYRVGDRTKRFFDEPTLRRLLADRWRLRSLEEYETSRFETTKVVWEAVATRE